MFKFVNNWERYRFYYKDHLIKDITKVRINGEDFPVIKKKTYETVYDHGHEYNVTSYTYMVITTVANTEVLVDIRDFDLDSVVPLIYVMD